MTRHLHRSRDVVMVPAAVLLLALGAVALSLGTGDARAPGPPRSPGVGRGAVLAGSTGSRAAAAGHVSSGASSTLRCSKLFVPAFFWPVPGWTVMLAKPNPPKAVILDISGTGPGTAPEAVWSRAVTQARHAHALVLGYVSTQYGARPIADAETFVANYAAWYGVTSFLFDEVSSDPSQLPYYRALSGYVRTKFPKSSIWLNTGDYPPRAYMRLGNVIMSYESPYASYSQASVPAWAYAYSPLRFAHNVYDTPPAAWRSVLALAHRRNAGWTYVTDGTGSNPYGALPSYWKAEKAADAGCTR